MSKQARAQSEQHPEVGQPAKEKSVQTPARDGQALEVQQKRELEANAEQTEPGRIYRPYTDVHETPTAVVVTMDVPGVDREHVQVTLENDVLTVDARVDLGKYEGLEPVYTEYDVGHYRRRFTLSSRVDQAGITARLADGVLEVTVPKAARERERTIPVT